MNSSIMKAVHVFRAGIYIALFLTLVFLTFKSVSGNDPRIEVNDEGGEKDVFWPPDIVPHPHLPGSGPASPKKRELA